MLERQLQKIRDERRKKLTEKHIKDQSSEEYEKLKWQIDAKLREDRENFEKRQTEKSHILAEEKRKKLTEISSLYSEIKSENI